MLLQFMTAIASILILISYILLRDKRKIGWLFSFASQIFWLIQGILIEAWFSQVIVMAIMAIIAMANYIKWKEK